MDLRGAPGLSIRTRRAFFPSSFSGRTKPSLCNLGRLIYVALTISSLEAHSYDQKCRAKRACRPSGFSLERGLCRQKCASKAKNMGVFDV